MAGTSLLALLDDIATILDDVATMTKVAATKTTGVLGDDLALNAEQVSGVKADRELPVVWAVAKGSAKNKLILVPAALAISAVFPYLITPLLMIGGLYLCFEGFEKIAHSFLTKPSQDQQAHQAHIDALTADKIDIVEFEQTKIKGAIRTDFILSAEIIVIALGTVTHSSFTVQALVVSAIAVLMTIGVYGLVAIIVKLDDVGFYLIKNQAPTGMAKIKRAIGRGLLAFAPILMRSLAYIGTAAMFVVGGGILLHGIPLAHELVHHAELTTKAMPIIGGGLGAITPTLLNALTGLLAGGVAVALVTGIQKIFARATQKKQG